jgi:hypothetical protein
MESLNYPREWSRLRLSTRANDEPNQPSDEEDGGDNPQDVDGESDAGQDDGDDEKHED